MPRAITSLKMSPGSAPAARPERLKAPAYANETETGSDVGRAVYKMRKAIVEPVFGQTRE